MQVPGGLSGHGWGLQLCGGKRAEIKKLLFSGNQFVRIRNRLRSELSFCPYFQQGFDEILMAFLDAGSIVSLSGIWPLADVG